MQNDFKIDCDWLFFVTSHGKGSVDAIGGAIKHRVWIKIRSRKRIISNPFEFYECAKEETKGTHIIFLSQEDIIQLQTQEMEEKWADLKSIPEIRQYHYIMPYDSTSILVARTAKSLMTKHNISKSEEDLQRQVDSRHPPLRYEDVYSDECDEEMCTSSPTKLPNNGEDVAAGSWVGVIYDSHWYQGN